MAKLKDLEKYKNYEFSSSCYTCEDYKSFERKYINYLKSICRENEWVFVKANKNHYSFSAFLLIKNQYVYLSISDVRFFRNEWYTNILIRKAKTENDYTGERNHYSKLPNLKESILSLLGE